MKMFNHVKCGIRRPVFLLLGQLIISFSSLPFSNFLVSVKNCSKKRWDPTLYIKLYSVSK